MINNTATIELIQGMIFNSIYFEGNVEVLSVNKSKNDLEVKITPPSGNWWFEHWNLQHTILGFEQRVYNKKR